MESKTIAVIPARGGSKGIPRKNLRILGGKPLVAYAIDTAMSVAAFDDVVVSTEDEEIAEIARVHGAQVVERPRELAADDVTLDPVIFHAVLATEGAEKKRYDFVVTIQPTSPLLSSETVQKAMDIMRNGSYDTLIAVTRATHMYWSGHGSGAAPIQKERRNRQQLAPIFRETGALLICRRDVIREQSRIGESVYLFEVPDEEAVDIDTYADWCLAETMLGRLNIVFRVDGSEEIGLGHIYRVLTLAGRLSAHNVTFLLDSRKSLGVAKVSEYHYPVVTCAGEGEVLASLQELKPHIVINDILDTSREYVCGLKRDGYFVVNFEDLGAGAECADVVVNALYENSYPPQNHHYGYRYECLRDEFYLFPKGQVRDSVENVLVTFGGVDESDLTLRTLRAAERQCLSRVQITVVLGLGYAHRHRLYDYVENLKLRGFSVTVKENARLMAKYMLGSDVAVTSNGRTIYELASLGIPCISISQNEREVRHLFAQVCKGIVNLGLSSNASEEVIASTLSRLIEDRQLRKEMSDNMLRFDLRKGINRVLRLILDGYHEWQDNSDNGTGLQ